MNQDIFLCLASENYLRFHECTSQESWCSQRCLLCWLWIIVGWRRRNVRTHIILSIKTSKLYSLHSVLEAVGFLSFRTSATKKGESRNPLSYFGDYRTAHTYFHLRRVTRTANFRHSFDARSCAIAARSAPWH